MAQPTSPTLNSQAAYLLQLTFVSSTQQASAPSLDVRNIRITQKHPQCRIGRTGDKDSSIPKPASNNAYFVDDALETEHALLTLNDEGELCIQNTAVLGGVSVNGEMLQKKTSTVLLSSSEIVLTSSWWPITATWKRRLTLQAIMCQDASASSSIENSSTTCAQVQRLSKDCADIEVECSPDIAPCGRKSQYNGAQEQPLIPRGASKRLRSQDELQDDSPIPSQRDKLPRLASCPDVHRWQESVILGPPPSQQHHSTTPSQGSLPDLSLTRSESGSAVISSGPSTRVELRNPPRFLDLLSDQAKEELVMSVLTGVLCGGRMPSDFRARVYPYVKAIVRHTSFSMSDIES